jgi:hypothetical protein
VKETTPQGCVALVLKGRSVPQEEKGRFVAAGGGGGGGGGGDDAMAAVREKEQ